MIGLIASISIDPAKADRFEREFETMAGQVRALEPDTLVYTLLRSQAEPGAYRIVETYRDQAALDAHRETVHFKAFRPTLGMILLAPPETEWLDVIV